MINNTVYFQDHENKVVWTKESMQYLIKGAESCSVSLIRNLRLTALQCFAKREKGRIYFSDIRIGEMGLFAQTTDHVYIGNMYTPWSVEGDLIENQRILAIHCEVCQLCSVPTVIHPRSILFREHNPTRLQIEYTQENGWKKEGDVDSFCATIKFRVPPSFFNGWKEEQIEWTMEESERNYPYLLRVETGDNKYVYGDCLDDFLEYAEKLLLKV